MQGSRGKWCSKADMRLACWLYQGRCPIFLSLSRAMKHVATDGRSMWPDTIRACSSAKPYRCTSISSSASLAPGATSACKWPGAGE